MPMERQKKGDQGNQRTEASEEQLRKCEECECLRDGEERKRFPFPVQQPSTCFIRVCHRHSHVIIAPSCTPIAGEYPVFRVQVSTGQHMQLTGDLKPVVSVAAQQGMYFNQQQTQNQAGPAANQTDTYCSVSQSQTINFTQQSLRQRAAAAAAAAGGVPQSAAPGPGARGHPQQVPPVQVDQHQHAKLLQQQQLMRAQQVMQQQQHMASGMGGGRPPPPEYKAAAQAQMMHASIGMSQQARFANAGPMRRVAQQPMPPSGSPLHPHQQYGTGSPGVRSLPPPQQHAQPPPATATDPSVAAADFSLEFLENLPTGDTSNFSAQELLNSLDSTAGFNLDNIL
ncbi:hypothetical protein DMN91_005211 [Ooceraea biroi]|uniref:Neurogenic protein mastermind n=1 Tax=Ooceraea biroi TaxID=2015173 RepID=A0A3L8DRX7_OOCBI|nr:hypothetical protein DMN91_005211 [Ooceraea biroi]